MDELLKEVLGTVTLKKTGKGGGGCINEGEAYLIDTGTVFVKYNKKPQAREMFDGESDSLKAIAATHTVHVPKPLHVLDNPEGGAVLVLEYLDMKGLTRYSRQLGEELARMHLHNAALGKKQKEEESYVGGQGTENEDEDENKPVYMSQFGFHTTTCCGYLPQDNTFCDDWPTFYARQRLEHQLKLIEKDYGDKEVRELWSRLQHKVPNFFKDLTIEPSLLHGDLWGGNVAESTTGPVVFDPASFYGHHEFELAIAGMFGGFNSTFYQAYHNLIPKAPGFEARHKLYQLYHYLNHWLVFLFVWFSSVG
ncbi:hypothetical protein Cfor_09107 [Coptotermes formosanus]|uniref:protein-ribulosamine 3-kinase n=1 Tax=Coptotermes formosanus TaxID=36987 RepID=A0A6L2PS94_COPFO|nr:hypothetical protein Cfor_09107 [Coptotermes formosanus]